MADIYLEATVSNYKPDIAIMGRLGFAWKRHDPGASPSPFQINLDKPYNIRRWGDIFDRMSRLRDGWNSYSAPAPTPVAIGNAKKLLTQASVGRMIPQRLEPSAMGGVGVTFAAGSREVVVEFYNAGNAHALFSDNETERLDTAPVATSFDGYNRLLEEVRRYLYGHNAAVRTPRPALPRR